MEKFKIEFCPKNTKWREPIYEARGYVCQVCKSLKKSVKLFIEIIHENLSELYYRIEDAKNKSYYICRIAAGARVDSDVELHLSDPSYSNLNIIGLPVYIEHIDNNASFGTVIWAWHFHKNSSLKDTELMALIEVTNKYPYEKLNLKEVSLCTFKNQAVELSMVKEGRRRDTYLEKVVSPKQMIKYMFEKWGLLSQGRELYKSRSELIRNVFRLRVNNNYFIRSSKTFKKTMATADSLDVNVPLPEGRQPQNSESTEPNEVEMQGEEEESEEFDSKELKTAFFKMF